MKNAFLLSLLLLTLGCGKNSSTTEGPDLIVSQIIGGSKIKEETTFSKHTVGIFNHHLNMMCTASIIEKDLVLTAAHCVEGSAADKIDVVFGTSIERNSKVRYKAHATLIHSGYVNSKELIDNDVALIRLKKPVPAPYEALDLEEGRSLTLKAQEKITALGYGMARTGLFSGKGVLRITEIAIKDYETNGKWVVLDQRQGTGICFGDSGGPSFTLVNGKAVLVGVTSFVSVAEEGQKPDCKYLAALSNPNYFYDWIMESKLKI